MKLLNSFQDSYCSPVCWTQTGLGGGLYAQYKKKDKMLNGQPAYDNVLASRKRLKNLFWALVHLKTRLLSFNRTQSGVVTNFPPGRNTLKRHLYLTLSCQN